ncbi:hypothetical protein J3R83DRAFT_3012 [Lanmaoa asiatica]|nr:hypothetical protein J3R83DRAFT_3012 [Lanmaoa asiatica]
MPLLDGLSDAAKAIGAVNTIVPRDGALYGENTDYLGIAAAVRGRASEVGLGFGNGTGEAALVIGAGGTARAAVYALKTLGMREVYVFNRTRDKAEAIAAAFDDGAPEAEGGQGKTRVRAIEPLGVWPSTPPCVIVSTVPAEATTTSSTPSTAIQLPTTLFTASTGVVVDMAYKPAETPLLRLAAETATGWARVRGVEVLLEQGYVQFEMWTGRTCPREKVRERVLARYDVA